MSFGLDRALFVRFAKAPPDERMRILDSMTPRDLLALDACFEAWAHDGQLPPRGEGWRVWLMLAGRGFGKTRAGAEWIHRLASGRKKLRIALVGATILEARKIMVEGVSGILRVAGRNSKRIKWEPALGQLTWHGGSVAQLFSGESADALRGPEHHFAWCDELAKWRQAEEAWHNLQMGLRAGPRARALVTTTPRPMRLLEAIRSDPRTVQTGGRTNDNITLARSFIEVMMETYGGTRLGAQELEGTLLADVEGALWTRELIARCRVGEILPPGGRRREAPEGAGRDGEGPLRQSFGLPPPPEGEELERVIVGVDPPAGVGEGCDACGIVVAGRFGGKLYVLADASVQGLSPEGWANRVAAAAASWGASQVVAEANNGGAMVESVLKAAEAGLRVKLVHASRGKTVRAEPVALKFETGRALLAGEFPELEAQLCGMVAGGGYEGPGRSPDRADAMVWALTELGETRSGLPRVRML